MPATKGCNYSTSHRGKPDPWFKPFLWRVEYFRTGTMEDRLWLQFNKFLYLYIETYTFGHSNNEKVRIVTMKKIGKLRKIFEFDRYLYPERKLTVNITQYCIRGVKCGRWKDYLIRITFITFTDGIKVIFSIGILLLSKTF